MARKRVLAIDDEPAILSIVCDHFQARYDAETAAFAVEDIHGRITGRRATVTELGRRYLYVGHVYRSR